MTDEIIQVEVSLNFLNTLLAKAVYFKDIGLITELGQLRHDIYYSETFSYELLLEKLKNIERSLKEKYE
jgi:hypothetical protein